MKWTEMISPSPSISAASISNGTNDFKYQIEKFKMQFQNLNNNILSSSSIPISTAINGVTNKAISRPSTEVTSKPSLSKKEKNQKIIRLKNQLKQLNKDEKHKKKSLKEMTFERHEIYSILQSLGESINDYIFTEWSDNEELNDGSNNVSAPSISPRLTEINADTIKSLPASLTPTSKVTNLETSPSTSILTALNDNRTNSLTPSRLSPSIILYNGTESNTNDDMTIIGANANIELPTIYSGISKSSKIPSIPSGATYIPSLIPSSYIDRSRNIYFGICQMMIIILIMKWIIFTSFELDVHNLFASYNDKFGISISRNINYISGSNNIYGANTFDQDMQQYQEWDPGIISWKKSVLYDDFIDMMDCNIKYDKWDPEELFHFKFKSNQIAVENYQELYKTDFVKQYILYVKSFILADTLTERNWMYIYLACALSPPSLGTKSFSLYIIKLFYFLAKVNTVALLCSIFIFSLFVLFAFFLFFFASSFSSFSFCSITP